MASRRDFTSTLAVLLLLIVAEGEGCGLSKVQTELINYLGCVKGHESVNLEKKVDILEEACRTDLELFRNCENIHFTVPLGQCITEEHANVTTMTNNMLLNQNRFLCDAVIGYLLEQFEFWGNDGLRCKKETSKLFERNNCFDIVPSFFDDYYNPATCNKQLEYLQCIRNSLSTNCNDFAKKVVFTYFKRSLLATPCRETLIKEDKTDLEILVTTTEAPTEPPTEAPTEAKQQGSDSSPSVESNAFNLSLTLLFAAYVIYV